MKTIKLTKMEIKHIKNELYNQSLFILIEKKKNDGYITEYNQGILNNNDNIYKKLNDNNNILLSEIHK